MALSPAKRSLLEKWLQGEPSASDVPAITRRAQNGPVTISFSQQRILFQEMLDRGTGVNNLPVFLQLKGMLDLAALEKSANQILMRHDILRTRFSFGHGIPAAEILSDLSITIPVINLKESGENTKETEACRLAEKEVSQPFDLLQSPLLRLRLYKLNSEKHFLLLIAHHTVADGWSLGVFLRELMMYYQANSTGRNVPVTDLSIQYYDYAYWQNDYKNREMLQSSMAYWKKQLAGELPSLDLPIYQTRGPRQTFRGGTHRFDIRKDQTKALEELSMQEDATLFMTLLTAFYLLLHRYSGQDDILVGTPVAGRNLPELENLIGVFINTLVLRVSQFNNPAFRDLLRLVRKVSLEAYAHHDLPFEKLLEELKPKRDLNRSPLFQVVFNLQNSPMPRLEMEALEATFLDIDRGSSQFDLTLMISRKEEQCHAAVEYNADLFDSATITSMFRYFQMILEHALKQPDSPISTLPLVTGEEKHHLIFGINQTLSDFPREKCLHQLIEEQVNKTPDAVAISYDYAQLTYGKLISRANALATYLHEMGVGPGICVGIWMTKSIGIVEAIVGILKAGGAYVPVHISTPTERLQFILKDANVQVLLTNMDPGPLDDFKGQVINLNEVNPLSKSDGTHLQKIVNSNDLAYIMYTSGSTGLPKGVMVNHTSLVNFLWSMRRSPGMNEDDVILALTSVSFDISILELFLPLIVGGRVVIASEEMTTNPELIVETINQQQVNMLQATPATWQLLINTGWASKPGLKALCGGDVMSRKLADQLLERVGSLWNMYGPTETTVWSTICQVRPGDNPVTIGQPIGNTQVYILDRYLQLVPPGVMGELHIAGEGLARAYHNDPQLTSEKFIPDFLNPKPGGRLYKTGDRVRYSPDYSIEVLGRIDDQVKIYGHRMELGEITAVLLQHPSVNDGLVISRTEISGDKRLVAYYVPKHNSSIDTGSLREFFTRKLPDYMIPAFLVNLDSLPLTTSGKVDRKSLPLPGDINQLAGYVAPRNKEEQIMANIWQSVLDVEQVGIHDNFFYLGGASIQSIQVVAQANQYGYRVSVDNIFEYQTIAELSAFIKDERKI